MLKASSLSTVIVKFLKAVNLIFYYFLKLSELNETVSKCQEKLNKSLL